MAFRRNFQPIGLSRKNFIPAPSLCLLPGLFNVRGLS
jgi:hypothetical protein